MRRLPSISVWPGATVFTRILRDPNSFAGPIVIAAGDGDPYCPVPQLQALHKELGARAQIRIVEGADHFFGGFEVELADAIESMLAVI